jgi:autotransporter-associated beta strand protein
LGHVNALGSYVSGSGAVVKTNSILDLNHFSISEPLTLNGGRVINGTLDGSIVLTADSIFEVAINDAYDINGAISGAYGLTVTGGGTLTFNGNNSYTGFTIISAGTLRITNDDALGASSGSTIIANGATLDLVN